MQQYHRHIDHSKETNASGRERYLDVVFGMGFHDVCECPVGPPNKPGPWRYRPNSGKVGIMECTRCGNMLYPLQHIYYCDECTEPTLMDKFPIPIEEPILCEECQ